MKLYLVLQGTAEAVYLMASLGCHGDHGKLLGRRGVV